MLTLFDLVVRSMRKNIKHYYLYFFALIFSVVLYFVFATLQHDAAIVDQTELSMKFATAFKAASILLIVIAGIFIVYANAIFLKRRSREIGLYQLIGLSKSAVVRLLIIENILLSIGALLIGTGIGMLVSRLFLLLLMKLIDFEEFIGLSFSVAAIGQTVLVFSAIILLTTVQMVYTVYRNSLLHLFNADRKGELPKKPRTVLSAILALLGIGLIIFGYWLSANMMNELLFFNMIAVLASTILGTYLIFRVTIGWLLYQIRARKQGRLGLKNSLSIASLMHRMKGNANSLTIITVLSAMTLAMLAGAYSLYYSTEKETRYMMPFDFVFEEEGRIESEMSLTEFEGKLEENKIDYVFATIEVLDFWGEYEKGAFPVWFGEMDMDRFQVVSASQLQKAGLAVKIPDDETAIFHNSIYGQMVNEIQFPMELTILSDDGTNQMMVEQYGEGNVLNNSFSDQLIVNDAYFEQLKKTKGVEQLSDLHVLNIGNKKERALASKILNEKSEDEFFMDFHSLFQYSLQSNGLLIFIAGFLGLVFLISTGSILYFKQMTEAEQERQSYQTLRQLGFSKKEMMSGIIRKQIFVFGLPLGIGLLHSIFAIKSASFIFMSDIKIPTIIAMSAYALIYLLFAILSIGYYRKVVSEAL